MKAALLVPPGLLLVTADALAVPLDANAFADVADRVMPAVVNVSCDAGNGARAPDTQLGLEKDLLDDPTDDGLLAAESSEVSTGSGVLISGDGYVVTNAHLVRGARRFTVGLSDRSDRDARLVGLDTATDLALLKIEGKDLPHLRFGSSAALRLGEIVLAVGNPYRVGQTITAGIVSAKGRGNIGIVEHEDFIQTDAAINPGNSGGALVDLHGDLVGISTAVLSAGGTAHGIGFAVPSDLAKQIVAQLRAHGRVRRGSIGAVLQDVTPEVAAALALERAAGALVAGVTPGGPADRARLASLDVIIALAGLPVRSAQEAKNRIGLLAPGTTLSIEVVREAKRVLLEVKVGDDAEKRPAPARSPPREGLRFGLAVEVLTDQLRRILGAPAEVTGVVVMALDPAGLGAGAGLTEGDVVTMVGRVPIAAPPDLDKVKLGSGEPLLFRLWRKGKPMFVAVRP